MPRYGHRPEYSCLIDVVNFCRCGTPLATPSSRPSPTFLLSPTPLLPRRSSTCWRTSGFPALSLTPVALFTARTTAALATTMAVTGPCGSSPSSAALMLPRSLGRSLRLSRLTPTASFALLASTTLSRCSAWASSSPSHDLLNAVF